MGPFAFFPFSRDPAKRPPAISPMRLSWPGVAPIMLGDLTSIWKMNIGSRLSVSISGGIEAASEFESIVCLQEGVRVEVYTCAEEHESVPRTWFSCRKPENP